MPFNFNYHTTHPLPLSPAAKLTRGQMWSIGLHSLGISKCCSIWPLNYVLRGLVIKPLKGSLLRRGRRFNCVSFGNTSGNGNPRPKLSNICGQVSSLAKFNRNVKSLIFTRRLKQNHSRFRRIIFN